jgi:hypothetical protein
LAGLVCEVLAVAGGAAALADGLGHVWVQLGDQAGVAGEGDAGRFDGQFADDVDVRGCTSIVPIPVTVTATRH